MDVDFIYWDRKSFNDYFFKDGKLLYNIDEFLEFFLDKKTNSLDLLLLYIEHVEKYQLVVWLFNNIMFNYNLLFLKLRDPKLIEIFQKAIINKELYFFDQDYINILVPLFKNCLYKKEILAYINNLLYLYDREVFYLYFKQITTIYFEWIDFSNPKIILDDILNKNEENFLKSLSILLILVNNTNSVDEETYNFIMNKLFKILSAENIDIRDANVILCFFNSIFRAQMYSKYNYSKSFVIIIDSCFIAITNNNFTKYMFLLLILIFDLFKKEINYIYYLEKYLYNLEDYSNYTKILIIYIFNKYINHNQIIFLNKFNDDLIKMIIIDKINDLNLIYEELKTNEILTDYVKVKNNEKNLNLEYLKNIEVDIRIKNKFTYYLTKNEKIEYYLSLENSKEKLDFLFINIYNINFLNEDIIKNIILEFKIFLKNINDQDLFSNLFYLNMVILYTNNFIYYNYNDINLNDYLDYFLKIIHRLLMSQDFIEYYFLSINILFKNMLRLNIKKEYASKLLTNLNNCPVNAINCFEIKYCIDK